MKLFSKTSLLRENPLKFALWGGFALIAALWSGTVLVSAELTKWLATSVVPGKTGEVITTANDWPVPAWLSVWIDPAWIQGFQAPWMQVLGWFGQTGPSLEGMVSWLIPLMWVIWGAVMLIGLIVALAGHLLIGKLYRSTRLTHSLA